MSSFDLVERDPHVFTGTWTVEARGSDCVLTMDAEFDLGMPSLSHLLDPIAIEAVEDAVGSVLRGLFGESVEVEYGGEGAAPASADGQVPITTPTEGAA